MALRYWMLVAGPSSHPKSILTPFQMPPTIRLETTRRELTGNKEEMAEMMRQDQLEKLLGFFLV